MISSVVGLVSVNRTFSLGRRCASGWAIWRAPWGEAGMRSVVATAAEFRWSLLQEGSFLLLLPLFLFLLLILHLLLLFFKVWCGEQKCMKLCSCSLPQTPTRWPYRDNCPFLLGCSCKASSSRQRFCHLCSACLKEESVLHRLGSSKKSSAVNASGGLSACSALCHLLTPGCLACLPLLLGTCLTSGVLRGHIPPIPPSFCLLGFPQTFWCPDHSLSYVLSLVWFHSLNNIILVITLGAWVRRNVMGYAHKSFLNWKISF